MPRIKDLYITLETGKEKSNFEYDAFFNTYSRPLCFHLGLYWSKKYNVKLSFNRIVFKDSFINNNENSFEINDSKVLVVNFKYFEKEKWNFYANAGGQLDLPLDGVLKTKYVDASTSTADPSQNLTNLKLQFSTSAGVGIQYNFTPRLGIYAEPAMLYYLDNGSAIGSVYKEKPVNFNLKMGLKWNLNK